MIGGDDILIEVPGIEPSVTMPAAVRYVVGRWPAAVMQDADTGRRFDSFAEMDFGHVREVFVYRDAQAFDSWERLGADTTNANLMIHLLVSEGQLTVVVDDFQGEAVSIVRGIRGLLRTGMPWLARAAWPGPAEAA